MSIQPPFPSRRSLTGNAHATGTASTSELSEEHEPLAAGGKPLASFRPQDHDESWADRPRAFDDVVGAPTTQDSLPEVQEEPVAPDRQAREGKRRRGGRTGRGWGWLIFLVIILSILFSSATTIAVLRYAPDDWTSTSCWAQSVSSDLTGHPLL